MTEALRIVVIILCAALTLAYVCRLAKMNWRTTQCSYVAFHFVWLLYAGWAGFDAYDGREIDFHLLPLIGSALWLAISWRSWSDAGGKPPIYMRRKRT